MIRATKVAKSANKNFQVWEYKTSSNLPTRKIKDKTRRDAIKTALALGKRNYPLQYYVLECKPGVGLKFITF